MREVRPGSIGLFVAKNVDPGIPGRNHLGDRKESRVSPTVVGVVMRVDDVPDGLIGDTPDVFHDGVVILLDFIVDQNDALICDQRCDVSTAAHDVVEIVCDLFDCEWRVRLLWRTGNQRYTGPENGCQADESGF